MSEAPQSPDPALLASIARDIATEAYTVDQTIARHEITHEYFEQQVVTNEYYQTVLGEYVKEWASLGSTHKRLAFMAAVYLEEKMPVLAARMGERQSALADAVATAKLFREIAGIATPGPQSAGGGNQVAIKIDFGHHKVSLQTTQVKHELDGDEPVRIEDGQRPTALLSDSAHRGATGLREGSG